jgi:hypothetical protein
VNTAHYSLLTLQPSVDRIDTLCVGAAVLAGDVWHIVTLPNIDKIKAVDGSYPANRLEKSAAMLQQLLGECTTLEQARSFTASQRCALSLHGFEGLFTYLNEQDFQKQIIGIMGESVMPIAMPSDSELKIKRTRPHIRAKLKSHFKMLGIYSTRSEDINDHKVVSNYPVVLQYGLYAEFAAKNGVMSFTETIDFNVADDGVRSRIFEAQAKYAVLRAAVDMHGADTKRHIIVNGASAPNASRSIELLSTVGELHDLSSHAAMAEYFASIERSTGLAGQQLH